MIRHDAKGRLIVGLDVDGVVIHDFLVHFCNRLYEKCGAVLLPSEVYDWNLKKVINTRFDGKIDGEIANEILSEEGFIRNLPLSPESKEAIIRLCNNDNVFVIFITALKGLQTLERDEWFKVGLPDLDYKVYFEEKKDNIYVDIIVDDGIHNLDMMYNAGVPKANCLCISQPYNQHTDYPMFSNLSEAVNHIELIAAKAVSSC